MGSMRLRKCRSSKSSLCSIRGASRESSRQSACGCSLRESRHSRRTVSCWRRESASAQPRSICWEKVTSQWMHAFRFLRTTKNEACAAAASKASPSTDSMNTRRNQRGEADV